MNALPPVSDEQVRQMNQIAEKQYGADINKDIVEEQQAAPEPVVSELSTTEPESLLRQGYEGQATSDDSSTVQAAPEPEQEQKQVASKDSKESFREVRERALRAEREKEQLMRFITERLPQHQQPQQAAPATQEENLEFSIAPDELAEGKHLAKLNKKIERLENQIKQGNQQSAAMSTEARLKAQYPDFEKVVSQSNIESLSEMYPEIAKTIGESSDLYNKAVSAYTMIKKFGIHAEDTYVQEKARVQANAVKPRPLASLSPQQGESPLSKANAFANGLTPELQKQLWKETKEAMKNG